jgi:hypothetical protein
MQTWADLSRPARRRLIDARRAAHEGRRYHAFYRGAKDCRAGRSANPYRAGSMEAGCWQAGYKYAKDEQ